MKTYTLLFFIFLFTLGKSQVSQTIRGEVTDKNTGLPLIGATVILLNSDPVIGVVTDENGLFRIEKVPVGRQGIKIDYMGYESASLKALYLESGKEVVVSVALDENVVQVDEVVIKAHTRKDKPLNEMAKISARSFTVEETEKYAGSWGDPSRMALNFAGVMAGSDQQNGIIIRGNSPNGLQFKLEGISIPNPNHFGQMGSTGGPISMLNNNVLSNSDFLTGAFPAQYGNALSGIFDLGLRTGNNQKREFMGQIGFNGFELGAEGPFSTTGKSSYLINYRYSTMGVFDALGIDMGIGAIPYYQDLSFKIDIPGTKLGRFTLFGLGGKNHISFETDDEYKIGYTDFSSQVGVTGLSHLVYLSRIPG
ncbi:MAG: carboxypeptidase-like regulatory domain-containing protein [Bacteroidales bacterium]|nr:carboxypeptidase-like regulatory domain-containing protein [Bacteroidales bacterium]